MAGKASLVLCCGINCTVHMQLRCCDDSRRAVFLPGGHGCVPEPASNTLIPARGGAA